MAFAVAGLRSREPIGVAGMACAETSFPGFLSALARVGRAHDHRRRRARGQRQGHDRPRARRAISACRTWTPACSTAPPRSTCCEIGGDPESEFAAARACDLSQIDFADPELKSETVGGIASRISAYPLVREALLERQQRFAAQPGGAVLDGRDIGTVIAPRGRGQIVRHRPPRDPRPAPLRRIEGGAASTSISPTSSPTSAPATSATPAATRRRSSWPTDAILLDTSELSPSEAVAAAIAAVEGR